MEYARAFVQSGISGFVRFSRGSQYIDVPSFILGRNPSEYAASVNELEEKLRSEYIENSPKVMCPNNIKKVLIKKVENGKLYYAEFSGEPAEGGYVFRKEVADVYASRIGILDKFKDAVRRDRVIPFRHRQYTTFKHAMVFLIDEINALRK